MVENLAPLVLLLWGLIGFGGYFILARSRHLLFLEGRAFLRNVIKSFFALAGPIALVGALIGKKFIRPYSYCPNYLCLKISPADYKLCPACGFEKDVFGTQPVRSDEVRVPSCLANFRVESRVGAKDEITFTLRCLCGGQYGHVLGHYESTPEGQNLFGSPFAFECEKRSRPFGSRQNASIEPCSAS